MANPKEEGRSPVEDHRGELFKDLVITDILKDITPDNDSGIPPFDISRLSTIDIAEQREISQTVSAQFKYLYDAIPKKLYPTGETDWGSKPEYTLDPLTWQQYHERFSDHLRDYVLSSDDVLCTYNDFGQDPSVTVYSLHAYYKGVLVGEMGVWTRKKQKHSFYQSHLFYGDGCAVEIREDLSGNALYEKEEIVYPSIPDPGYLDPFYDGRRNQTYYRGEADGKATKSKKTSFVDSLEDSPHMFVEYHNEEYIDSENSGSYLINETVEHVDYPRNRRIHIRTSALDQMIGRTDWYAFIGPGAIWRKISEKTSDTNDILLEVKQFSRYDGPFKISTNTIIQADESSPYYEGTAVFTLDSERLFPSLALKPEDILYTPKQVTYTGKETQGKQLKIEFINDHTTYCKIRPGKAFLDDMDVTVDMYVDEKNPMFIRFKGGVGLPRGLILLTIRHWHLTLL